MSKIIYVIIGLGLLAASIEDIRKKQISMKKILFLFLAALIGGVIASQWNVITMVSGAAIGIMMLGLSQLTEEKIGKGDGLLITALGILLGFRQCLIVVTIACGFMSVLAMFILISKKGTKQTRLPFVPALSMGYVICLTLV